MTSGKAEKAESWYRKFESMDPDNLQVLHNLGVIYISMKRFKDAEKCLLREIELYGDTEIRFRVLGDLYYSEGSRKNAGNAYQRALKLNAGWSKSTENFLERRIKICKNKSMFAESVESGKFYEKGSALQIEGKQRGALDFFIKAAESDSTNFIALNAAGTVLLNHFNDYGAAMEYFQKALEVSDMPLIQGNLALTELMIRQAGGKP